MDEVTWKEVSKIFDAAIELPETERAQWVAKACKDNKALLSEVESLLAAGQHSDGLLDLPLDSVAAEILREGDDEGSPPTQIGPYEIREEMGRGGMGVVFRAWDPRLNRDVAVKLLPRRMMADETARLRLLAEARAASALDHPNICTVYDIGKADDGSLFFAMACYEGQTLTERIAAGPMAAAEAVDIAKAVLNGLDHAHAHGVIHRDVKPSNVFLTNRGEVKILDFGLAKRGIQGLTDPAFRLGTSAYLAPEQVLGLDVDARTDLWQFGVTFYQMLSGELPFAGPHEATILYNIVNEEPLPLPEEVPAAVRAIVGKLLSKEPEGRFQSAAEVLEELEAATVPEPSLVENGAAPVGGKRLSWPAIAGAGVLLAIAGFIALRTPREPFVITAGPSPLTSFAGREERPALSRDGSRIAFSWNGPALGNYDIYIQNLGSVTPVRLTEHPAWESSPAWSPDETQIAYLREMEGNDAEVWLAPVAGGEGRRLAVVKAAARSGLSWSPDGKLVAAPDRTGERGEPVVVLVSTETGEKQVLAHAPAGAVEVRFPAFAADGRSVAFHVIRGEWLGDLYLAEAPGGATRLVASSPAHPEGLAWLRESALLLYSLSSPEARRTLWYASLDGKTTELALSENPSDPTVAADGSRLAFSQKVSSYDIVSVGLSQNGPAGRRFASSTRFDGNPQVSPDGSRVVFSSSRSGAVEIWICDADGRGAKQLTALGVAGSPRWSPDGKYVAFDSTFEGNSEIYVISAAGGPTVRVTTDPAADYVPTWSRDGEWIYFASARAGEPRLWKAPADGSGGAVAVSEGPALYAHESADGKWIYYAKSRTQETEIWRMTGQGGAGELVLPGVSSGWANWVLLGGAIYYVDHAPNSGGAETWAIYRRLPGSAESELLAVLDGIPTWGAPGFSVAPGGQLALVGEISVESDLMYVDGRFR